MTIGRGAKMEDELSFRKGCDYMFMRWSIEKKFFGNGSCKLNPQLWFYKWIERDKKQFPSLHEQFQPIESRRRLTV